MLETTLIQLAKEVVEMSLVHQSCLGSHHKKFEMLERVTATLVAVVVAVVRAAGDVSQEAGLVHDVRFL